MRKRTPTRDELAHSLGEGVVRSLESLRFMEGLDLLDRIFVCAHGVAEEYAAHAEVGEAYLRARARGTCPVLGLSDSYWSHWDIDGLCDIFPCPHCAEENIYTDFFESLAPGDRQQAEDDDTVPDDAIQF